MDVIESNNDVIELSNVSDEVVDVTTLSESNDVVIVVDSNNETVEVKVEKDDSVESELEPITVLVPETASDEEALHAAVMARQNAEYAKEQGDYAKAQGDSAKLQSDVLDHFTYSSTEKIVADTTITATNIKSNDKLYAKNAHVRGIRIYDTDGRYELGHLDSTGNGKIELYSSSGIDIEGEDPIYIISSGSINADANENITLTAAENVDLKGKEVNIDSTYGEIWMNAKGRVVLYSSEEEINIGTNSTNPKENSSIKFDSGKNIEGTANRNIMLNAKGGSISMTAGAENMTINTKKKVLIYAGNSGSTNFSVGDKEVKIRTNNGDESLAVTTGKINIVSPEIRWVEKASTGDVEHLATDVLSKLNGCASITDKIFFSNIQFVYGTNPTFTATQEEWLAAKTASYSGKMVLIKSSTQANSYAPIFVQYSENRSHPTGFSFTFIYAYYLIKAETDTSNSAISRVDVYNLYDFDKLHKDFVPYGNQKSINLTPYETDKRIDSNGEVVSATGWKLYNLGDVKKGWIYKISPSWNNVTPTIGEPLVLQKITNDDDTVTYKKLYVIQSSDLSEDKSIGFVALEDYTNVIVSMPSQFSNTIIYPKRFDTYESIIYQINTLVQDAKNSVFDKAKVTKEEYAALKQQGKIEANKMYLIINPTEDSEADD